jgi:hypothetical protein
MSYFGIQTAFPSSISNQCYIFVNGRCVVLNYHPGRPKTILQGPHPIERFFPMLSETPFKRRIDCAFNGSENTVVIFCRKLCAKIRYTPRSIEGILIKGPRLITHNEMFPRLRGTSFCNGIDAAIRYGTDVFLFKGVNYIRLNYFTSEPTQEQEEICKGFPYLVGTVFENGIDAAFASHVVDEAYIFKDIYYARIDVAQRYSEDISDFFIGGRIRYIRDVWPPFGIRPKE